MKVISNDFRDGEKLPLRHVFNGMGYEGDNISPHLARDEVPAGTKSFVVTCFDPDAPTGSGWWHWVVANLPADTRVLTGAMAPGWSPCQTALSRHEPISVKRAMAARRRPKAKPTAISLPFTHWMWTGLTSMKVPAGRWWDLTSISTRLPAPQLPRCSVDRFCAG